MNHRSGADSDRKLQAAPERIHFAAIIRALGGFMNLVMPGDPLDHVMGSSRECTG